MMWVCTWTFSSKISLLSLSVKIAERYRARQNWQISHLRTLLRNKRQTRHTYHISLYLFLFLYPFDFSPRFDFFSDPTKKESINRYPTQTLVATQRHNGGIPCISLDLYTCNKQVTLKSFFVSITTLLLYNYLEKFIHLEHDKAKKTLLIVNIISQVFHCNTP